MKVLISFKLFLLASMVLVLSACGFKTIYNNADWVLAGMVDDYVTLTEEQESDVEKRIELLMKWHRKSQLTIYSEDLKEIKQYTQQGLNDENTEIIFAKFLNYWQALRDRISPEMAGLFLTLDEKQKVELFKTLDEQNKEIVEESAEITREEMIKNGGDKMVDNFSDWLGELSPEQETLLRSWPEKFKPVEEDRMKFRLAWQAGLKEILFNDELDNEQKNKQLVTLINNPEDYQSDEHKAKLVYNSKQVKALMITFNETITNEQKAHVGERIDHFSRIFAELAVEE
ncbi:hypothetical protein MNBD_GAMMA21-2011 [hydrothermal vent metagenome]|uniref:Lipoprotein n=1 Tax=hydrothermal vent metagenome TaxID=652676 RepID=A0A3B1A2P4_9ZZZZ